MQKTKGRNTQKSHRRCRHAPHNAVIAPATCCEGNAAPCTRPHLSIKLISAVNGPPVNSPCHIPESVNHGLCTGKSIAMMYPSEYPTAEYVITAQ